MNYILIGGEFMKRLRMATIPALLLFTLGAPALAAPVVELTVLNDAGSGQVVVVAGEDIEVSFATNGDALLSKKDKIELVDPDGVVVASKKRGDNNSGSVSLDTKNLLGDFTVRYRYLSDDDHSSDDTAGTIAASIPDDGTTLLIVGDESVYCPPSGGLFSGAVVMFKLKTRPK